MPKTDVHQLSGIIKDLGRALQMPYCDDQIGSRIRRARLEAGLTQAELAFPGCGLSNLSQIERGNHLPKLEIALRLVLLLNTNPKYLYWGRGPRKLLPERQRYILEFLGLPEAELQKLLRRRQKSV